MCIHDCMSAALVHTWIIAEVNAAIKRTQLDASRRVGPVTEAAAAGVAAVAAARRRRLELPQLHAYRCTEHRLQFARGDMA